MDELPLKIFNGCPVFLEVTDAEGDGINCYRYEDSCTPGFCDAQVMGQNYVVFEDCALLLPSMSSRAAVGISVEDTVGAQTLLELPLNINPSGETNECITGAFSSANPSQCHLVVQDEKIKIIVYASTTVDGVSISGFHCAVQSNPDEELEVSVSEVTGFDSTVINTIDPNGKGAGSWQKFEIEIESKKDSALPDSFPLCCFYVYEDPDYDSDMISQATCDITVESIDDSKFTIMEWVDSITTPMTLTTFPIHNFEIELELSHLADATQLNAAAYISFLDQSSLEVWQLSVDDINDMNNGNTLTVNAANNHVTISLDQSKKSEIPLNVELSVSIENGFFQRTVSDCKQYSEEFSNTLTFCFYEEPSINGSNIIPHDGSNVLAESVDITIGISGVQFGPLQPGSSATINVFRDDNPTTPNQVLAFSGSNSPLVISSNWDEVTGTIDLVDNHYYTVEIPSSFVQVPSCSSQFGNQDTLTFTICSIDLVMVEFKDYGVAMGTDGDIKFELFFVNDIKIGVVAHRVIIGSNIINIFDNAEGNRYKIENNKATITLPSANQDDVREYGIVFPAELFLYKNDNLCIIPSKQITRSFANSFDEAQAQVLQSNVENTVNNNGINGASENEAAIGNMILRNVEDSQPIPNSQTVLVDTESEGQTAAVVPQVPQESPAASINVDSQIPTDTVVGEEQPTVQRQRQDTIRGRMQLSDVPIGITQRFNEAVLGPRRVAGRFFQNPEEIIRNREEIIRNREGIIRSRQETIPGAEDRRRQPNRIHKIDGFGEEVVDIIRQVFG